MRNCRAIPAGFESDDDDEYEFFPTTTQKVTVVPEQNLLQAAGLNGEDFDAVLPKELADWFYSFRQSYNTYKRIPLTEQQLKLVLIKDDNPLLLALKFFAASPGSNNLKNKNLALFVLELICEIATKYPGITGKCDDNTRMVAFNFVKLCGINSIYKAVIKAYGLKAINQYLLPKLQQMLEQGYYKDVAYWAMFLDMTESFGVFELVFPLILQDKTSLAEEYIQKVQHLQLPTVQFLDSLLNKEKTVFEHCDELFAKYRYINVGHSILSHKPMSKLVTRLAKKYKIDEKFTPNLVFTKRCGYVRFLFYKYHDGEMNSQSWRELVPDAAQEKPVQLELIKTLATHGEINEAYFWLEHFQLTLADCMEDVRMILDVPVDASDCSACTVEQPSLNVSSSLHKQQNSSIVDNSSTTFGNDYLKLSLNEAQIVLIDNDEAFHEMVSFLKNQQLIAFDSEWKPSVSSDNAVSLLQLATRDCVYLLDCLSSNLTAESWKLLGREIFNNLEVLKIGFSIEYDLRILQKSLPLQLNLHGGKVCWLDVRELWRRLKYMEIIHLPYASNEETGESLSALTEACLGKKLDKSNQCSNWANRPLRRDQIMYAALDSYCLLQIYQVFSDHLQRIGLDIDKVVEEITTGKTGYLFRMKSTLIYESGSPSTGGIAKAKIVSVQGVISVPEIRFICDQELSGLSKELRKLGIDCIVLPDADPSYYYTELRRDQSYLLTRQHQRHAALAKDIGREKFLQVSQVSAGDQAVFVLSYFNIKAEERHFYTRCLECNNNEFILAYKEEIKLMRSGKTRQNEERRELKTADVIQHDKSFLLLNANEHIISTKTTYRGKPIRLQRIKDHHLKRTEQFFICDACGYVIWNGAHPMHGNVAKTLGCDMQSFPCV